MRQIIDWEFFQLWRGERGRFNDPSKAADQVKKKLEKITAAEKDLILFAGNQADPRKRKHFMILGCCYPKRDPQQSFTF